MASGDTIETITEVYETSSNNLKDKDTVVNNDHSADARDKDNTLNAKTTFHDAGQRVLANVAKSKAEREKERERKIGHRRVGVGGEITYKKIQTSTIMGSIQLECILVLSMEVEFMNGSNLRVTNNIEGLYAVLGCPQHPFVDVVRW